MFLESAPPSPVDVTITLPNSSIATVSRDRTAAGGASVTFPGVNGTFVGRIYVQGRATGSTTLLAQAPGYNDRSRAVTVTPSGFRLASGNFSVGASAPNVNVDLRSTRLAAGTLNFAGEQELRGGLSVAVEVTSSDTAVGPITNSPVTFSGGGGVQRFAVFDPQAAGQTTIAITQPPGFSKPANVATAITATVT